MDPTEFIDNLKRDKARGVIAPHQIVLLIAFYNIYKNRNSTIFNIEEINFEFQKVWKEYNSKFRSKSNFVGMPLKSFYNQSFIGINIRQPINDFRRLNELKKNILSIILDQKLINFLETKNLNAILAKRFEY